MSVTEQTPDPDIEAAFKWLLTFLEPGEWEQRKAAVMRYLEALAPAEGPTREGTGLQSITGPADQIAWYLYLTEMGLYDLYSREVNQETRVLPVMTRIGEHNAMLRSIRGVEGRVRELLRPKSNPDQTLFEMVVALLWARNGYDVEFIPAHSSHGRTPDFKATKNGRTWYVEVKRLTAVAEYSRIEREKWLNMWGPLKEHLRSERIPVILDLTFHKELKDLDDSFLIDQLPGKLELYQGPGVIVENETWTVHVSPVDYDRIRRHLKDNAPKVHSRQFQEMVGGRWRRGEQFVWVADLVTFRKGPGRVVNEFADDLRFVAGAYWKCDAPRAIETKARDILGHLSKAVGQFPEAEYAVIHTGIDTPDGTDVERERFKRMVKSVTGFDPDGKNLQFVYCHLYESYSVPDSPWFFDETIVKFRASHLAVAEPLSRFCTVLPDDAETRPGVHWHREAP